MPLNDGDNGNRPRNAERNLHVVHFVQWSPPLPELDRWIVPSVPMSETEWKAFLTEYSRELLADDKVRKRLPPEVIETGWLGYAPASEAEIMEAEVRLGIRFSPSYRAFLGVSNGWRSVNTFIYDLWPSTGITWFRERNQEWIDAYVEASRDGPRLSDEEYLVYGEAQDPSGFRREYLQSALEISDTGDAAILLLNPEIVTPEGEWEAWFFGNWLPGAWRYRSFEELMRQERRGLQAMRRVQAARSGLSAQTRKTPQPWGRFW